ncbi:mitochondrial dicarboxylate carrier [Python bivittatus]|uniref:Mitochondrial dicarboxylate carrier n=1 Tax=Python bivittatus TaxID=176946 RepID=A0A9F5IVM7_PYTBI|nr:mitochondrial dicarboxylate carrier [Python bivittatus]
MSLFCRIPRGLAEVRACLLIFQICSLCLQSVSLLSVSLQLACYDQAKQLVLGTGLLADNIFTHFLASFIAGGCATFLCQPLDVLKTRLMNSQGEYRGVLHCAVETAKLGPLAFYKGLVPAGIRLIPHTVLTFVFLEQLRKYFGIKVLT